MFRLHPVHKDYRQKAIAKNLTERSEPDNPFLDALAVKASPIAFYWLFSK
jgi:hypothetical protein